jgi:hypothetical protein
MPLLPQAILAASSLMMPDCFHFSCHADRRLLPLAVAEARFRRCRYYFAAFSLRLMPPRRWIFSPPHYITLSFAITLIITTSDAFITLPLIIAEPTLAFSVFSAVTLADYIGWPDY